MVLIIWFTNFVILTAVGLLLHFIVLLNVDLYDLCPGRFLIALLIPTFMIVRSKKHGSLSLSGMVAAFIMGFVLVAANYSYIAALITFFLLGSKATKYRSSEKSKIFDDNEAVESEGKRNWRQVIANGGVALELSLCSLHSFGCSAERPINFGRNYLGAYIDIAVLGAVACAAGDTLSSELGSVLSKEDPILITTFQRVPKGTNGGVSVPGIVASLIGGLCVGIVNFCSIYMFSSASDWNHCRGQFLVIVIGTLCGIIGSLIDSILGATLQYSGFVENKKRIVETPGYGDQLISGCDFLSSDSVNLLATMFTAFLAPPLAFRLWSLMNL